VINGLENPNKILLILGVLSENQSYIGEAITVKGVVTKVNKSIGELARIPKDIN
jgi:hypothetical protein